MSEQLRQLQSDFLAAFEHGVEQCPQILQAIVSSDGFAAQQRWMIYRDSIVSVFINTLATTFPVCQRLVGELFFAAMAAAAIDHMPSRHPDLNTYGQHFAAFIAEFEPARSLPYLADVARLEWAVHQANLGPDVLPTDFAALAERINQAAERVNFQLPANATLLASAFPIDKIWQVNQLDYIGDDTLSLDNDACCLLIWRREFDLMLSRLDQQEQIVLTWFSQGVSLTEVLVQAEQSSIDMSLLLPRLVQCGYLNDQGG